VLVLLDVVDILSSSTVVVSPNGYFLVLLLHSVSDIVISIIPSPINLHIKHHIQKVMKIPPKILSLAIKN
jgi:hypothetical protein